MQLKEIRNYSLVDADLIIANTQCENDRLIMPSREGKRSIKGGPLRCAELAIDINLALGFGITNAGRVLILDGVFSYTYPHLVSIINRDNKPVLFDPTTLWLHEEFREVEIPPTRVGLTPFIKKHTELLPCLHNKFVFYDIPESRLMKNLQEIQTLLEKGFQQKYADEAFKKHYGYSLGNSQWIQKGNFWINPGP